MRKTICKFCGKKITCHNKGKISEVLDKHYETCKQTLKKIGNEGMFNY